MSRDLVNTLSRDLPGATWSAPWGGGHDAWKVGGKLFALVGAKDDNGLSVKCPDVDTARLLIDMGRANRAPYLHASWVRIPFGLVPDEELADRIRISYGLIRKGLTRKVQATPEPWPE